MLVRSILFLALGFLLGAAAAGGWARLYFIRALPTFRCKMRRCDYSRWTPHPWPYRRLRAAWAHDVLLVQRGLVRPRTVVLPARSCDRAVRTTDRCEVTGLGRAPVVLSLRLDGGRTVEVAARRRDTCALAGPFLTAALRVLTEPRSRDG